jgi:aconitate hydratase
MSNLQSKIKVETTANSITTIYENLQNKISTLKKAADRPLTISEKILIGHLAENIDFNSYDVLVRGKSYVLLNPGRVALQDVTGQMTNLHAGWAKTNCCSNNSSL